MEGRHAGQVEGETGDGDGEAPNSGHKHRWWWQDNFAHKSGCWHDKGLLSEEIFCLFWIIYYVEICYLFLKPIFKGWISFIHW